MQNPTNTSQHPASQTAIQSSTPSLEEKLTLRLESLRAHKSKTTALNDERSRAWISKNLSLIGIPTKLVDICVEILEYMGDTRLVWLHLQECTGCSESLLRTEEPGFDVLIFDIFKLHYHDLVLAASGHNAHEILHTIESTPYVLLVEGSVSMGEQEEYITLGGKSGYTEAAHLIDHAQAVFAVGTCSSYGGIQTAHPNPTNGHGLKEVFDANIVHIPGCPPSDKNIIGNLLYFYLLGETPPLDELGRPLFAYAKSVHDLCERRNFFLSGDFVQSFDDPAMAQGYCLYKVGCKGPYTFNNCPKVKFNAKTSWPVQAGHGCIGCSEPNFWDNFGLIEKPISNDSIAGFTPRFSQQSAMDAALDLRITQCAKAKDMAECGIDQGVFVNLDSSEICLVDTQTNKRYRINVGETRPAQILEALESKSKQTKRLCENYQANFPTLYSALKAMDTNQTPSESCADFCALLGGYYALLKGETLESTHATDSLIKEAQSFAYPHVSPLGFKWKERASEESESGGYNGVLELDSSKALSNLLAYYIGGLDVAGVSFSIVSDLGMAFGELLRKWNVQGKIMLQGRLCASRAFVRSVVRALPRECAISIAY